MVLCRGGLTRNSRFRKNDNAANWLKTCFVWEMSWLKLWSACQWWPVPYSGFAVAVRGENGKLMLGDEVISTIFYRFVIDAAINRDTGWQERRVGAADQPRNSSIVSEPGWLMPSRLAVLKTVRKSIFRSRRRVRLSTYQTSRRNLSSHERALRPFT